MDILEAISNVNSQIRHFHLVHLEHDMTSDYDLRNAEELTTQAENAKAAVCQSYAGPGSKRIPRSN